MNNFESLILIIHKYMVFDICPFYDLTIYIITCCKVNYIFSNLVTIFYHRNLISLIILYFLTIQYYQNFVVICYKSKQLLNMKKTFYLMGLLLLTIAMTLTSCDKPVPETKENTIVLGDDVYQINSAISIADNSDNDVELVFYCNDITLSVDLEGYKDVAVGVYDLAREGRYTAEVDVLGSDRDFDVTGTLAISIDENNLYNITISGEAYKDRGPRYFSMIYQGELSK